MKTTYISPEIALYSISDTDDTIRCSLQKGGKQKDETVSFDYFI